MQRWSDDANKSVYSLFFKKNINFTAPDVFSLIKLHFQCIRFAGIVAGDYVYDGICFS